MTDALMTDEVKRLTEEIRIYYNRLHQVQEQSNKLLASLTKLNEEVGRLSRRIGDTEVAVGIAEIDKAEKATQEIDSIAVTLRAMRRGVKDSYNNLKAQKKA